MDCPHEGTRRHWITFSTGGGKTKRHRTRKELTMMNGFGMGFGGIWWILSLVLVGLAIAALIKYLRK